MEPNPSFLRVSSMLYRGPQPLETDLEYLNYLGIKCIFNLRKESELSKDLAKKMNWKYFHIPIQDGQPPPQEGQVWTFLNNVHKEGPSLVTCLGGIGRTAVMVACYRIWWEGLTANQALAVNNIEMKSQTKLNPTEGQKYYVVQFERKWRGKNVQPKN